MKKVFFGKGGITVTVTTMLSQKKYRVEILVPKKSMEKEIQVENCQFRLKLTFSEKFTGEEFSICLEKEYKVDSCGNIIGVKDNSKFKFWGEGFSGKIILYPKAYIPKSARANTKYENMFSQIKRSQDKKPSSKYVNYTYNNAARPYSGGGVSPK